MVNNLILVPDIQEAKCSEFTVQILLLSPPPISKKLLEGGGATKKKENYNIIEWIQIFNDRQFCKMCLTYKKYA